MVEIDKKLRGIHKIICSKIKNNCVILLPLKLNALLESSWTIFNPIKWTAILWTGVNFTSFILM